MAGDAEHGPMGALRRRLERTAVAIEALLVATAILGTSTVVTVVFAAHWARGAVVGSVDGIERCTGIAVPPGSRLECGYYVAGFPRYMVAVVRSPVAPYLGDIKTYTFEDGDPYASGPSDVPDLLPPSVRGRRPVLPQPSELGLGEPSARVGPSELGYTGGEDWRMWVFREDATDETVTYLHWWVAP